MAIPARVKGPGTYFVTSATWERRRTFQVEANAYLFLSKLTQYRLHFALHAYVIMPDHIHLLITPADLALEQVVQRIKGGFSHALSSKSPVWQRGFSDHRIRDANDALAHMRYIEQNPLGAHLAQFAADYPFSSAHTEALQVEPLPDHLQMPPQGIRLHLRPERVAWRNKPITVER